MNVGDACSNRGFEKLVHGANPVFRREGNAESHFMWISKEIVESIPHDGVLKQVFIQEMGVLWPFQLFSNILKMEKQ
jgi:hypothetical protein